MTVGYMYRRAVSNTHARPPAPDDRPLSFPRPSLMSSREHGHCLLLPGENDTIQSSRGMAWTH